MRAIRRGAGAPRGRERLRRPPLSFDPWRTAVGGTSQGVRKMVKVGDVAPSFKAKNHKGQDVELGKLKGKTVVLWFYPRADTPG
jgi:peroxiredoxin Q/BCP